MQLYLLDMGSKIYGDCIVVIEGDRKILIDGAHPGDWKSSGGTPSIPEQLGDILGQPPFQFDLLVVTHCHSDHIGCLPRLVKDGTVEFAEALVADEDLGFPGSGGDAAIDAETAKVIAALQEEPQPDLRGAALDEFLLDAATLADNYAEMLDTLKQSGTRILRYTGPNAKVTQLEQRFADFHLRVLGPTNAHLKTCRDLLARSGHDALVAVDNLRRVDATRDAAAIYRALVAEGVRTDASIPDDLRAVLDMAGSGAARNDQSIVLKLGAGNETVLLTGDMQLAKSEVAGPQRRHGRAAASDRRRRPLSVRQRFRTTPRTMHSTRTCLTCFATRRRSPSRPAAAIRSTRSATCSNCSRASATNTTGRAPTRTARSKSRLRTAR